MFGGYKKTRSSKGIMEKPWTFLAVFLVVFFVLATVLFALDFYPEAPADALDENTQLENTEPVLDVPIAFPIESPTRIVIDAIGVDTVIENPTSTDIQVLDNALLSGAVRYPGSALLGENARMLVFGHQSGLPVVHNKAFKAFNGLQNLKNGEEIIVFSETAAYHYRVVLVEHKSATDGWVELGPGLRTLTLTTCDSFGAKTDRYVVTAEFISRNSII